MLIRPQVRLGSMSGLLGIEVATPIVVAAIVQRLFVEDAFDTGVEVLGEGSGPDEAASAGGVRRVQATVPSETAR